ESALAAGFDPRRVYRIPNGVDLERFAPPGRDARAPREIMFVGAILERKGLHLILHAMEKLLPTYPDLRLTVAGPWIEGRDASHDAYVRDLRARLVGQPLSDCVQVLGAVERPEDVLRRASIFVLPSDAEGLPNALLEAMATAAVPIVTDLPSMREVVDPGISGLLVGERNASSWAEALGRLLSDRALLNRMSAAARDVVTARFGLAAVAEQYRGLFCKSMRGSR
ncbi:MAG: glycosyltransferase, partial [Candidatus Eisenbacteria bacterium]|nr:glycosyltransferase [Candidatus Eisenbacteria bacterium]